MDLSMALCRYSGRVDYATRAKKVGNWPTSPPHPDGVVWISGGGKYSAGALRTQTVVLAPTVAQDDPVLSPAASLLNDNALQVYIIRHR